MYWQTGCRRACRSGSDAGQIYGNQLSSLDASWERHRGRQWRMEGAPVPLLPGIRRQHSVRRQIQEENALHRDGLQRAGGVCRASVEAPKPGLLAVNATTRAVADGPIRAGGAASWRRRRADFRHLRGGGVHGHQFKRSGEKEQEHLLRRQQVSKDNRGAMRAD